MTPYTYDIKIYRGADFLLDIIVFENDNVTPYYFNGTNATRQYECQMDIWRSTLGTTNVFYMENNPSTNQFVEDTIIFSTDTDGKISFRISDFTTSSLPYGIFFYRILLKDDTGLKLPLMLGRTEIV
jgi:hypothetical protein